ncbi:MAG: hypothetical protein R3F60_00965 [bacterium]
MNFEETLSDSYRFKGPLGAVAHVVLRGLEAGGVDEATVDGVLDALRRGLKGMNDEECDVLVQVLEHRLAEARRQGALYELVRLTGRLSSVEAHVLHDALAADGIRAQYNHDHRSDPFPDHNADVELWVPRGELGRARRVVAAQAGADPDDVVHCAHCGEENPANFGACWSCSQSLAATAPAAPVEAPAEE